MLIASAMWALIMGAIFHPCETWAAWRRERAAQKMQARYRPSHPTPAQAMQDEVNDGR